LGRDGEWLTPDVASLNSRVSIAVCGDGGGEVVYDLQALIPARRRVAYPWEVESLGRKVSIAFSGINTYMYKSFDVAI